MNNTLENRVVVDIGEYLGVGDDDFLIFEPNLQLANPEKFKKDYIKSYMAWISPKCNDSINRE